MKTIILLDLAFITITSLAASLKSCFSSAVTSRFPPISLIQSSYNIFQHNDGLK